MTAKDDREDPEKRIRALEEDLRRSRQAEAQLRKDLDEFSKAIGTILQEGFLLQDQDGRIVASNPGMERITGLTAAELAGHLPSDLHWRSIREDGSEIPGEDHPSMVSLRNGTEQRGIVMGIRRHSGELVWISVNAIPLGSKERPSGVMVTAVDITCRKQAEETLANQTEELENFFNNSRDLICIADTDGYLRKVNLEWERLLGYTVAELEGMPVLDLVHPDDLPSTREALSDLSNQKAILNFENRYRHKDGSYRWLQWRSSPYGKTVYAVARDVTADKVAEEALRKAKEEAEAGVHATSELLDHLNEAQRIAMIGSWDWDMENGTVWWSDETYRIFGVAPGAYVPGVEANARFFHPDDTARFQQAFSRAVETGEVLDAEVRIVLRDGTVKHCHARGKTIVDDEGKPRHYVGTIRDITTRKRAEETLRESEERYRLLVETANEGIWSMDADHRTSYVNQAMADMLGYPVEEIVGKKVEEFFFPEDMTFHGERMERRRAGADEIYERRFRRKDGGELWTMVSAKALWNGERRFGGSFAMFTDITERRRVAETLREREEKYRLLTENMKDVVWSLDTETLFFTYVSPSVFRLRGYTAEEILSMPVDATRTPKAGETLKNLIRRRTAEFLSGRSAPETFYIDEEEILCKDGSTVWAEIVTGYSINDKTGHVEVRGVTRDISERKQMERERVKLQAQLHQAQRMESLGVLAGGIAHDFNNILASIIGYTEIAADEPDEAVRRGCLEQVLGASDRARNLVRQILAFSRRTEGEKTLADMRLIVKESLKLMLSTVPATTQIRQKITARPCMIDSDPTQIHQILMNLCTNAVHAMGEKGGVLSIDLDREEISSLRRTDMEPGVYVRLTVSDTGCGIDAATMDRIFEPFFTTKKVGEGTGLGLSVVYGIVRNHGGTIDVSSRPGEGATFTVYIPCAVAEGPVQTVGKPAPIEKSPGTERILFVDDEKALANLGEKMLQSLGYRVTAFTDSQEALRTFRTDPNGFDLVISDMTMPHMTGKELAGEILASKPAMPIIICTGHSEFLNEETAAQLGIRALVMKPFSKGDLARIVRETLDNNPP